MKRKEIEQLQAAGLISAEQAVAIAEHFHLNGGRRWNWLVLSMSTLAGGLILGGIIMLISANWEIIPDLVKMEVTMALLLGFWVSTGARQRDFAAAMSGWVRWLFSLGFCMVQAQLFHYAFRFEKWQPELGTFTDDETRLPAVCRGGCPVALAGVELC